MDVRSMPAAREMDALVAEKVMGAKTVNGYVFRREQIPCPDGNPGCLVAHYGEVPYPIPRYSTDIAAVWEVLQCPKIMDKYQIGIFPTSFGQWVCRCMMPGYDHANTQAETAPLAICRAALLAVGAGAD